MYSKKVSTLWVPRSHGQRYVVSDPRHIDVNAQVEQRPVSNNEITFYWLKECVELGMRNLDDFYFKNRIRKIKCTRYLFHPYKDVIYKLALTLSIWLRAGSLHSSPSRSRTRSVMWPHQALAIIFWKVLAFPFLSCKICLSTWLFVTVWGPP